MDYFKEVNLAVTICDKEGKILEMNDKSRKTFLKPGQEDLIGKMCWIAIPSRLIPCWPICYKIPGPMSILSRRKG